MTRNDGHVTALWPERWHLLTRTCFVFLFFSSPCQLLSRWRLSLIIFPPRSAAFSFARSWIICVCALLLADSCAVASQSVFQIRWIMNKALQQKSRVPLASPASLRPSLPVPGLVSVSAARGGARWGPPANFKFNSHIHGSIRLFSPLFHAFALMNWSAFFIFCAIKAPSVVISLSLSPSVWLEPVKPARNVLNKSSQSKYHVIITTHTQQVCTPSGRWLHLRCLLSRPLFNSSPWPEPPDNTVLNTGRRHA